MTDPDLLRASRRSFLGWTAAIAGCALLTRPALAVVEAHRSIVDVGGQLLVMTVTSTRPGTEPLWLTVFGRDEYGRPVEERLPMSARDRNWVSTVPFRRGLVYEGAEVFCPEPAGAGSITLKYPA